MRVWSRNASRICQKFAERESKRWGIDHRSDGLRAGGCRWRRHLICTTTSAREPILMGEWIAPGTHIKAVGSSVQFHPRTGYQRGCEFAGCLWIAANRLINEAGDFLFPKKEGAIDDDHIHRGTGRYSAGAASGPRIG